ncbi:MAG: hypothetical protein ACKO14_04330 [Armatimonadota bacterium]
MRISILEPLSLVDDNGTAFYLSHKEQMLVAMLLASPVGCSRVSIQNALWPTSTIESRQVRLSQTLAKLRKIIGQDSIKTIDGNVCLDLTLADTELGELEATIEALKDNSTTDISRQQADALLQNLRQRKLSQQAIDTNKTLGTRWAAALQSLQAALSTDFESLDSTSQSTKPQADTVQNSHGARNPSVGLLSIIGATIIGAAIFGLLALKPKAVTTTKPVIPKVLPFTAFVLAEDRENTGVPTNSEATAVAVGAENDVFACGYMRTAGSDVDGFLMRVNRKSGLVWKTDLPGFRRDCDRAFSVLPEPDGSCWVAGDTYIDQRITVNGREIPVGWHLIVWKVGANGIVANKFVGQAVAVESPRDAWLTTDNVGGVWAAIQSRKSSGSIPEVMHIRENGHVDFDKQVGDFPFVTQSIATDRFGQVFLAGSMVGTSQNTVTRKYAIMALDAHGRLALSKNLGDEPNRQSSYIKVEAGPDDQMWVTQQLIVGTKLAHRVMLMSSSTYEIRLVDDFFQPSPSSVLISRGDTSAPDRSVVSAVYEGGLLSITHTKLPESPKSVIELQTKTDSADVLSILAMTHRDSSGPAAILTTQNAGNSKWSSYRFSITGRSASVSQLDAKPEVRLSSCVESVCAGYVLRDGIPHAVVGLFK